MTTASPFIPADVADDAVALVDGSDRITYGELRKRVADFPFAESEGLVILATENTLESIATYIVCVERAVPVLLMDNAVDSQFVRDEIRRFNPVGVIGFDHEKAGEPTGLSVKRPNAAPVHPDLCVMLGTSGSTGNPKFVKLSRENILSNAHAIAEALGITSSERAMTSLPFSYTYGLSVINSHVVRGAEICVTPAPVVGQDFWNLVKSEGATSLAGVPTTYKMLRQMRWDPKEYPSLRYLTQAGGRLPDIDRSYFLDLLADSGVDFYVMYGQTEATARITIAPPSLLRQHISTAGYAIPGGVIDIINPDEKGIGEVVYSGPNVMMGYAEETADLLAPTDDNRTLTTGDLGYLEDNALFLVGRTKRIVKIFGVRVSLDDVDRWLSHHAHGVAVQGNDIVVVFIEAPFDNAVALRAELAEYLKVNKTGIRIEVIDAIPTLSSGKVDLQTLTAMATS